MARIRSVKPELRDSLLVASWPFEVRYFFVLLWGYLDDKGRGRDMPKRIAGDCYPHDDIGAVDIDNWLTLMTKGIDEHEGPVCRYEVAGHRYIHCINWSEHQRPNRPTPSRLPPCPLHEGLSESLTESPLSHSLPGAAERGSRGAGERRREERESLTELPPKSHEAAQIVINATACTFDLAAETVLAIHRERKPRNLAALVQTLIKAGELGTWMRKAQAVLDAEAREMNKGPS